MGSMESNGDAPPDPPRAAGDSGRPEARRPSRGGERPRRPRISDANRSPAGDRRHRARVMALQILYEVDVTGHALDQVLAHTFAAQEVPAAQRAHVERLVRGVLDGRAEIDPYIAAAAPAFPPDQLPTIDRNVLRLAIFELLHEPGVPPKAAINEAVELGKRFGGPNSGRFVNGVLGTIVERVRRDDLSVVPDPDTSA